MLLWSSILLPSLHATSILIHMRRRVPAISPNDHSAGSSARRVAALAWPERRVLTIGGICLLVSQIAGSMDANIPK